MGIILRHESIFCMKIIYGNRFEGGVFIDSCFNVLDMDIFLDIPYHITQSERQRLVWY